MADHDKIVVVTRRTRLEEMIARFNTVAQARFCITQAGGDFAEYQAEHDVYHRALDRLRRDLDLGLKVHFIERGLVPTYLFAAGDVVVTVGQDGLVANTARYVGEQPLVAVNPDPARFDGILLPFVCDGARGAVERVLKGRARHRSVTLAEVTLGDGQRLVAFNDLFIGARTHVSARYRLRWGGQDEAQSSSGVLVSTGAGSTGWLSSVYQMARGVSRFCLGGESGWDAEGGEGTPAGRLPSPLPWDARQLVFVVREPFVSRHSSAGVVAGRVDKERELRVESLMPSGGVIFGDGMEDDFLAFDSGSSATIRPAPRQARLVVA